MRWIVRNIIKRTKRQYYFDYFNKRYIRVARRTRYHTLNDGAFTRDGYDAAISGSDQVWNPEFAFNTDFEFLPFVPPEKRYSYAASFGVDEVPPDRYEDIGRLLREMREISVREETGRAIVKELANRDVPVHVDPTLLLELSDYERLVEKPPQTLPERYIITYFLDEVSDSCRSFISRTAENLGLPVIMLNEWRENPFFDIGPQHFLYLIQNADYVCTDSFHGTVFSILFHRQFTCFYRQGKDSRMGSRLNTLLGILRLEDRLYDVRPSEQAREIDYAAVDKAIDGEREIATAYLRKIVEQL